MPKIGGSREYYQEVQLEMEREQVAQRDAEINIIYPVMMHLRLEEHKSHAAIQRIMHEKWGLGIHAYRTRLEWIRRAGKVIP